MHWNYGLRTLFLVMFVVAAFCFGWICKERWDGTPISTLIANPSRTEFIIEILSDELDRRLQDVARVQSQLHATGGGLERELRQIELERAIEVADRISQRIDQLDRVRRTTLIPYWFPGSAVGGALVVSMWVISCVVAMWIGVRLTQNRSRPVND